MKWSSVRARNRSAAARNFEEGVYIRDWGYTETFRLEETGFTRHALKRMNRRNIKMRDLDSANVKVISKGGKIVTVYRKQKSNKAMRDKFKYSVRIPVPHAIESFFCHGDLLAKLKKEVPISFRYENEYVTIGANNERQIIDATDVVHDVIKNFKMAPFQKVYRIIDDVKKLDHKNFISASKICKISMFKNRRLIVIRAKNREQMEEAEKELQHIKYIKIH